MSFQNAAFRCVLLKMLNPVNFEILLWRKLSCTVESSDTFLIEADRLIN